MPSLKRRFYNLLIDKAGCIAFLAQELPGLGIWVGVMTIPFVLYIIIFLATLPMSLVNVVSILFYIYGLYFEQIYVLSRAVFFAYAAYYLHKNRKDGVVTSGPYKYVYHPQYFGLLLMTVGFGSWSYIIYATTFGVAFWQKYLGLFFDPIKMWYIEFAVYLFIAKIEEIHLSKKFGDTYMKYQNKTPFLLPIASLSKKEALDIAVSVIFFIVLFHLTIYLSLTFFL